MGLLLLLLLLLLSLVCKQARQHDGILSEVGPNVREVNGILHLLCTAVTTITITITTTSGGDVLCSATTSGAPGIVIVSIVARRIEGIKVKKHLCIISLLLLPLMASSLRLLVLCGCGLLLLLLLLLPLHCLEGMKLCPPRLEFSKDVIPVLL